jgi:electron transfer flavoprotein beta subunit
VADVAAVLRWTALRTAVDPLTGAVVDSSYGFPAADWTALEHALRLGGARAVCVAPAGADLREVAALAPATWLETPRDARTAAGDAHLARVLAPQLEGALVLCGDHGTLPAFLAHELGVPQALGVVRIDDGIAERRLDHGRRERLRIAGPAVVSVEAAGVRVRRAPLSALLRDPDVPRIADAPGHGTVTVTATLPFRPPPRVVAPPEGDAAARLRALAGVDEAREPPTVVGPVDSSAAADALLGFLERHGYLTSRAAPAR